MTAKDLLVKLEREPRDANVTIAKSGRHIAVRQKNRDGGTDLVLLRVPVDDKEGEAPARTCHTCDICVECRVHHEVEPILQKAVEIGMLSNMSDFLVALAEGCRSYRRLENKRERHLRT